MEYEIQTKLSPRHRLLLAAPAGLFIFLMTSAFGLLRILGFLRDSADKPGDYYASGVGLLILAVALPLLMILLIILPWQRPFRSYRFNEEYVHIGVDRIEISFPWGAVYRLRQYSSGTWKLQVRSHGRSFTFPQGLHFVEIFPADELSPEVKAFIVQQVKAHGGRVS